MKQLFRQHQLSHCEKGLPVQTKEAAYACYGKGLSPLRSKAGVADSSTARP